MSSATVLYCDETLPAALPRVENHMTESELTAPFVFRSPDVSLIDFFFGDLDASNNLVFVTTAVWMQEQKALAARSRDQTMTKRTVDTHNDIHKTCTPAHIQHCDEPQLMFNEVI